MHSPADNDFEHIDEMSDDIDIIEDVSFVHYSSWYEEWDADYKRRMSDQIAAMRQNAFSIHLSNQIAEISITELQSMVFRAGKIIDTFLPIDRSTGKKMGFGFVRSRHYQEAQSAIEMVQGRSWGGRRISAYLAHPPRNSTPNRTQIQGSPSTIQTYQFWRSPTLQSMARVG